MKKTENSSFWSTFKVIEQELREETVFLKTKIEIRVHTGVRTFTEKLTLYYGDQAIQL